MPGAVRPKFLPTLPFTSPLARPTRAAAWRKVRVPIYFLVGLLLIDLIAFAARSSFARYSPDDYAEKVAGCASRRPDFVILGGSPVAGD